MHISAAIIAFQSDKLMYPMVLDPSLLWTVGRLTTLAPENALIQKITGIAKLKPQNVSLRPQGK